MKMEKAEKYLKASIIVLALFSALLIAFTLGTGALSRLSQAVPLFLASSALLFLFSVLVWLFAWSLLVGKRSKKPLSGIMGWGYASVFGSLTPIQLGSDALRSIFLKDYFGIPMRESFSASMIVKGLKFSVLAIASTLLCLWALSASAIEPALLLPLFSGLAVILLAAALFLLPLNKNIGYRISALFGKVSRRLSLLKPLEGYFKEYSHYLEEISKGQLAVVFLLCAFSWLLEFLALLFVFRSLSIAIPLASLAVLFVLVAVLERAPFLPRGILLVEAVGFAFLSFPIVSSARLSVPEIASVLVVFDVARLIVPALSSMLFYFLYKKISRKAGS